MRFANHDGRLTLLTEEGRGVDVERASGGTLPAAPDEALRRWPEVLDWAGSNRDAGDVVIDESLLGPPSPRARTAFGVGFNYAGHIEETGAEVPEYPTIFAKLYASLAGPFEQVPISTETVDWEVELAVVIGRRARRVAAADAWDHVAGLTVSQDISDRGIQLRPKEQPQFTLGKSLPGFCPTGPCLVTVDEFDDPDDLELRCTVNGEEVQHGRTSEFIFSVGQLIEYLSTATELLPGDLILTGTPAGIGATMDPPRFLSPGDVLESEIVGIGTMRQEFVEDRVASVAAGS
jgi:2-keto-4-pentenoate hydratase/2-oxohepta-3-ene-1,7-dioic acid hydratase in catechol pathway